MRPVCFEEKPFWASAQKGRCPVGNRGEFKSLHLSVCPSICTFPRPFKSWSGAFRPEISSNRPKSTYSNVQSKITPLVFKIDSSKSKIKPLRSKFRSLVPKITPLRPNLSPYRPVYSTLWPEIWPTRPQICNLKPRIWPFRSQLSLPIFPFRPQSSALTSFEHSDPTDPSSNPSCFLLTLLVVNQPSEPWISSQRLEIT